MRKQLFQHAELSVAGSPNTLSQGTGSGGGEGGGGGGYSLLTPANDESHVHTRDF